MLLTITSYYDRGMSPPDPKLRLGHLLKHAYLAFSAISEEEFRDVGISGRECAVLLTVDGDVPISQRDAASRLGIDRSTMVQLIDTLESRQLVVRKTDNRDRRRNAIQITPRGRAALAAGLEATVRAETRFLITVSRPDEFKAILQGAIHHFRSGAATKPGVLGMVDSG
jgi:DNA-binding MarR family transcriptional regulator